MSQQCSDCLHLQVRSQCGAEGSPFFGQKVEPTSHCEYFAENPGLNRFYEAMNLSVSQNDQNYEQTAAVFREAIGLGLPADTEVLAHAYVGATLWDLVTRNSRECSLDDIMTHPRFQEAIEELEKAVLVESRERYGTFDNPLSRFPLSILDYAYVCLADVMWSNGSTEQARNFLDQKARFLSSVGGHYVAGVSQALGHLLAEAGNKARAAEWWRFAASAHIDETNEFEKRERQIADENYRLTTGSDGEERGNVSSPLSGLAKGGERKGAGMANGEQALRTAWSYLQEAEQELGALSAMADKDRTLVDQVGEGVSLWASLKSNLAVSRKKSELLESIRLADAELDIVEQEDPSLEVAIQNEGDEARLTVPGLRMACRHDSGVVMLAAGDPKGAATKLSEALTYLELDETHYFLAVALQQLKRPQEAISHYQRAEALGERNDISMEARKARTLLENSRLFGRYWFYGSWKVSGCLAFFVGLAIIGLLIAIGQPKGSGPLAASAFVSLLFWGAGLAAYLAWKTRK